MTAWLYSALFMAALFAWPAALSESVGQPYLAALFLLNAATALFVMSRCSSEALSFFGGLNVIAGSSLSGCANVTLIYLPFLLTGVYLVALYQSLVSLSLGRGHSQGRWLALAEGFHRRRLNAPLNPLTHLAPPDPANFETDPTDPQNLLEAASLWEMEGEWDRAIGLYRQAAEMLRGQQDGVYAENCILRVREKIERAGGDPQ
jgi:hypothetical protein